MSDLLWINLPCFKEAIIFVNFNVKIWINGQNPILVNNWVFFILDFVENF